MFIVKPKYFFIIKSINDIQIIVSKKSSETDSKKNLEHTEKKNEIKTY